MNNELIEAMRTMMREELEPINHRLGNLEAGQKNLEASQKNLEASQKNLEASQTKIEARLVKIENDIEEIKESTEEIRSATNRLIAWAEVICCRGYELRTLYNIRQSKRLRHKRTDTISRKGHDTMSELSYTRVGDYLLPNLTLSDPPDAPPLGRYGRMHKEYLRTEKPALYAELSLTERLYPLCREVDEAAAHRLTVIGNRETAHDVILSEIVYI